MFILRFSTFIFRQNSFIEIRCTFSLLHLHRITSMPFIPTKHYSENVERVFKTQDDANSGEHVAHRSYSVLQTRHLNFRFDRVYPVHQRVEERENERAQSRPFDGAVETLLQQIFTARRRFFLEKLNLFDEKRVDEKGEHEELVDQGDGDEAAVNVDFAFNNQASFVRGRKFRKKSRESESN